MAKRAAEGAIIGTIPVGVCLAASVLVPAAILAAPVVGPALLTGLGGYFGAAIGRRVVGGAGGPVGEKVGEEIGRAVTGGATAPSHHATGA